MSYLDRFETTLCRELDLLSGICLLDVTIALCPSSALGSDTTPLPSWAALNNNTWGTLKQALKGLSVEFALLADKAVQQVSPSLFFFFCSFCNMNEVHCCPEFLELSS